MNDRQNGPVCLGGDGFHGVVYWQSRSSKHPVYTGIFDEIFLTSIPIREDKFHARMITMIRYRSHDKYYVRWISLKITWCFRGIPCRT